MAENHKLAKKIASRILKMDPPRAQEGSRLAIMFRGKDGTETSPGGRNKVCLIGLIEEILNESK